MTKRIAWFDCFSGASGDMILGALVDAGCPLEDLAADLAKLPCGDEIELKAEPVMRSGIRAIKVHVHERHGHDHHDHDHGHGHHSGHGHHEHRGLTEIRGLIEASSLSDAVKERAVRIFTRLGECEAAVHGVSVDDIHFHEVGALDAIADIVGAACALARLGVDEVFFSELHLGGGTVKAAHGVLPVPAPATARLVEGLRCAMGPVEAELLTPTGAAITL